MTSRQNPFPPIDAMIIGAQKAATTSLKNYLMQHPQIAGHVQKEFAFFQDNEEQKNGYRFAYKKYFQNGQPIVNKKIIAKHASLYSMEENIQKLKEHNPDALLIFSLRNPIDRAYSSYLMELNSHSIKNPFNDVKTIIKKHQNGNSSWMYRIFIDMSIYHRHLENIYKYFPKEQVFCFLYEDFKDNPFPIIKEVFSRLKINSDFIPDISIKYNITSKSNSMVYGKVLEKTLHNDSPLKRIAQKVISYQRGAKIGHYLRVLNRSGKPHTEIDKKTREYLADFFYPHNRELEKLTGFDLSHWDK